MNSAFALFEIIIPRTSTPPFLHLTCIIFILALYLSLAYLTHATQGFYTYSFLDPNKGRGRVVAYVFGILAASIVIFLVVWCLVWVRKWLTEKILGKGETYRGRAAGDDGEALSETK